MGKSLNLCGALLWMLAFVWQLNWTLPACAQQTCNPLDPNSPCNLRNGFGGGIDATEGGSVLDGTSDIEQVDNIIFVPTDVIRPFFQNIEEGENEYQSVKPFGSIKEPGDADPLKDDPDHTGWSLITGVRAASLLEFGLGKGRVLASSTAPVKLADGAYRLGPGVSLIAADKLSHQSTFKTIYGEIVLPQNTEAVVEVCDDCLRVFNLTALKEPLLLYVPVRVPAVQRQAITSMAGTELVVSRDIIHEHQLLVEDEVARRNLTKIADNYGVCEFSVETLFSRSDYLSPILKQLPPRLKAELMNKWSKVAAVLSFTHGRNGFMLVKK